MASKLVKPSQPYFLSLFVILPFPSLLPYTIVFEFRTMTMATAMSTIIASLLGA